MVDKIFTTLIQLNGDGNSEFINYWDKKIKDMTANFFCILNFKENNGISKTLNSFNIIFKNKEDIKLFDNPLMEISFLRVEKYKEFKEIQGKEFKQKINKEQFLILFANLDDPTESGMKSLVKFYEKLKKSLELPELVLLPYNENVTGVIYNSLESDFIKAFKGKLISSFTTKFQEYQKYFEAAQKSKEILRNEDKMYEYIIQRKKYLSILACSESWKEIQDVCSEDLFQNYRLLSRKFMFHEANNFRSYSEEEFDKNIQEKTLSNLEYQQFLFFFYVRALKQTKEFEKISNFFMKIFMEISQYTSNFSSMFHYYFWNYNLSVKMISYLKYLKINFASVRDNVIISKGEINILYYTKKILKNYALCAQIDIPGINIFILALEYKSENALVSQLNGVLNSVNEEMDNNQQYLNFVDDIKEKFDDKFSGIFLYHKKFLQEYLIVLNSISKLHQELNEKKLQFRVVVESIPLLFALSKFEETKMKLIDQINEMVNKKWSYLYETVNFLMIIFLNCLNKTYENLSLILKSIEINFSRVDNLIKILQCENENIIYDITSEYLQNFETKETSKPNTLKSFLLNNIFNFTFEEEFIKNEFIYINIMKEKEKKLKFSIENLTGLHLKFTQVKLFFEDKTNGNEISYLANNQEIKIEKYQKKSSYDITILFNEDFKENNFYLLKEIHFILESGVFGIFELDLNKKQIIFNIQSIDTQIDSKIYPSYIEEKEFDDDTKNIYYYNVICSMKLKFSSLPEMKDKKLLIEIKSSENSESEENLRIVKNLLVEDMPKVLPKDKIKIFPNIIEFPPETILSQSEFNNLNIPFVIEDTNFQNKIMQKLFFKCKIIENEKEIYSFSKTFNFNIQHILNFSERLRLLKNETILLQTTFKLNIKQKNFSVYLKNDRKTKINLDMSQSINTILNIKKYDNEEEILNELANKSLTFSVADKLFQAEYPKNFIISEIKKTLEMPYHIFINAEEKEHKIFEEFILTVKIQKLFIGKCLVLLKIIQNENWSILGKSKIIQKFDSEKGELKVDFKLIPLLDGFLKVPEIELMKFDLKNIGDNNITDIDVLMNTSTLVFDMIPENSIIEGNERIVKINPINSCTLRLNVT